MAPARSNGKDPAGGCAASTPQRIPKGSPGDSVEDKATEFWEAMESLQRPQLPRPISRIVFEKIAPVHPRGAGVLHLSVVIGKDGSVIHVDPLDGPELLIGPAIDAVKQWKYRPTLLNGHPLEVLTSVDIDI